MLGLEAKSIMKDTQIRAKSVKSLYNMAKFTLDGVCACCGLAYDESFRASVQPTPALHWISATPDPASPVLSLCPACDVYWVPSMLVREDASTHPMTSDLQMFRYFVIMSLVGDSREFSANTRSHFLRLLTYDHAFQRDQVAKVLERIPVDTNDQCKANLREIYHHRHQRGYVDAAFARWMPCCYIEKPSTYDAVTRKLLDSDQGYNYSTASKMVRSVMSAVPQTIVASLKPRIVDGARRPTVAVPTIGKFNAYELKRNRYFKPGESRNVIKYEPAEDFKREVHHAVMADPLPTGWTGYAPPWFGLEAGDLLSYMQHKARHAAPEYRTDLPSCLKPIQLLFKDATVPDKITSGCLPIKPLTPMYQTPLKVEVHISALDGPAELARHVIG